MTNSDTAKLLSDSLDLEFPAVALTFHDTAPAGIAGPARVSPSACMFWRMAETSVFFAPADAHFNCPVGAMVMGFDLPDAVSSELMELVGTMTKCGYIAADEAGRIPVNVRKGSKGVLYGPLSAFPENPDAVLLWLTPWQAMIANEATGSAAWGNDLPSTMFGRPACAAIPEAQGSACTRLSLGCMGMRTFTGIDSARLLAVVPGAALEKFAGDVKRIRSVNNGMETFYKDRAARFGAG